MVLVGLESDSGVRLGLNVVHLFNDDALEFSAYRSRAIENLTKHL
jgi:hypothetical protein